MASAFTVRRLSAWCAGLTFMALAPSLAAQQPADTLQGRVIAADSTPIPQAIIRATSTDGREQATTTDASGRYRLVLQSGPGAYAVKASAFGYLSFTAAVQVVPHAGRVTRDFRLSARPVVLEEIRVVAATPASPERGTPAERGERWESFLAHVHPLDPGDFTDVGVLIPGVIRSGDGLSVAGQSPEQNGMTVDGATFGGASLPSEGVRSVGVFGTTYDVSKGQFSGGQIAASTISGTNLWGGAFTAQVDDPALRYGGPPAGLTTRNGQLLRMGAGGGGALVRDRLFVYGALDLSHSGSDAPALDRLDADALRQLALARDSALRFAQIARGLGIVQPGASPLAGAGNDAMRGLARVDWALSRHGSFTARLDWRGFELSGLGASPFRLSGGTGELRSGDGGLMLQHAGTWRGAANTLRVYRSVGRTQSDGGEALPSGLVRVSSTLEDGTGGISFLSLGGTAALPDEERGLWEISDGLRLAAWGEHELSAGLVLQEERARRDAFITPGAFTFESLEDLERGRASSFTRVLDDARGEAIRRYGALYVGDTWAREGGVWITYGVRLEGSRYTARTDLPAELQTAFGADAAQVPSDLVLMPRVGIEYHARGWGIEGGAGGFAGVPSLAQLAPRWGQTGEVSLVLACVGPAAPAAEWTRYAADPATVPVTCAGGSSAFAATVPSVTVFDRGFRGARTWRASLSAGRSLSPRSGMRISGLLVRGTGLPSALDRNLRDAPVFTLAEEGGRPVYAPPLAIDTGSGGTAAGAGRPLSGFGAVEELGSRGESWTAQLEAGANGFYGRGILWSLRYTLTHSRIRSGGIAAPGTPPASTGGDPNQAEWTDAPFTPRHHLFASVSGRPARRLRMSVLGTLASGLPFTPVVGGDINGDGRANDRAFLFDPDDTADPILATGMRRVREDAPAGVRACLREGAGRVAAPGACRTPWSPSLDLRAEFTPWGALNARRFVLAVDARNITAGLDHLLHGPERLRGWGQPAMPDTRLLEVRGFDPARQAFLYDVNPRFGQPLGGGMQRAPFRLVVEGRIAVGADPRYQPLMRAVELGSGRSRESIRAELAARLRNVPGAVLQLHAGDTTVLALTPAQRAFLRAAADSLAPRFAAVLDLLATAFTPGSATPAVRAARIQEASLAAVQLQQAANERTRAILTAEQWSRLPAWLTRPAEPDDLQRSPTFQATVP